MQRKWYRSVLEKDIDAVNGWIVYLTLRINVDVFVGLTGKKEGKTRLMNVVMQVGYTHIVRCGKITPTYVTKQLRKVTCHPYLFDGAVRILQHHPLVPLFSSLYRNLVRRTPPMNISSRIRGRWSFSTSY